MHLEFFHSVNGLSCDIHHSPADLPADRHHYGRACGNDFHPTAKAVSGIHGHRPDGILTNVLLDFKYKISAVSSIYGQCFMNSWNLPLSVF